MSLKPASSKVACTWLGSSKLNGVGSSKCSRPAARRGRRSSSFSSSERQHTNAIRPVGFNIRRKFENAAAGSEKAITPNREKNASTLSPGRSSPAASPSIKLIWSSPCSFACRLKQQGRDVDADDATLGTDQLSEL